MNIFETLIIQPVFNLLIGLYSLIPGGDFGVALIVFTILIRLAMWPLVKKQIHQVKIMRKLQPELVKIKKATKGNKQLESVQMMELYKQHGVNPFRSIGILLVQLPIFIALYQVIQIFTWRREEIEKFTYSFLEGLRPVRELIENPDGFNETFLHLIDLTQRAVASTPPTSIFLFLLAIGAAVTQYLMSKQTMPHQPAKKRFKDIMKEAADGKQADQSEMNALVMGKMVKFLPIMMFFIMINLPGALALYYMTSNLVAVLQQGRILKHNTEEMDKLADKTPQKAPGKKATAKARAKAAREAKIMPNKGDKNNG